MSVTVLQQPPIAVFRGEEDVSSAGPRREALRRCLRTESPLISVDLGDITFLDSSAVGDLIHMADALAKKGRALEIRRCSRDTLRLLQLAGLGMIGSVHFTEHSATVRVLKRKPA